MSLKSVQTTCIEWADNLNVMFYLHDCLCKEWETVNFCTEFEWWPRSVIKNVSSHVYWNDDISIYPFISAIFFTYPMDDNIKYFWYNNPTIFWPNIGLWKSTPKLPSCSKGIVQPDFNRQRVLCSWPGTNTIQLYLNWRDTILYWSNHLDTL